MAAVIHRSRTPRWPTALVAVQASRGSGRRNQVRLAGLGGNRITAAQVQERPEHQCRGDALGQPPGTAIFYCSYARDNFAARSRSLSLSNAGRYLGWTRSASESPLSASASTNALFTSLLLRSQHVASAHSQPGKVSDHLEQTPLFFRHRLRDGKPSNI